MQADIDIDFADRQQLLKHIRYIPARLSSDPQSKPHNTGIYATDIPYDAVSQCAAIDYETAEQRGYFKIDLLNMSVYQLIRDPAHYQEMLGREPPWQRLWNDVAWSSQLIHIGNYTQLLVDMRPDSIPRMAAFISVIRPGKSHLQNQSWDRVFAEVWDGDTTRGYTFKKSHAVSYAALVALHMNLLDLPNQCD